MKLRAFAWEDNNAGKVKSLIMQIIDTSSKVKVPCQRKGVNIIKGEVCPDHIHLLAEIPPKMSVSYFIGYLKGKSTLMIFERHANLKYKYGNRHFWCRGYYVDMFTGEPIEKKQ